MPRSRNTRIRPKNTSRADARRRYRDDQRAVEDEPDTLSEDAAAEQPRSPSAFQMPNVREDIVALPQVFRKPLVWLPFGMLLATLLIAIGFINGVFDDLSGPLRDVLTLYVSLTLHPTSLFIFFIGGFVAPRASYMVGGILGTLSAIIYLVVLSLASEATRGADLEALTVTGDEVPTLTSDIIVQTLGMGVIIGVFAGGFAAWYRRFLRSSQQRAQANRMQKEQEQARKAKEQARADKQAAREARRRS